jgi:hypothetical protein
MAAVVLQFPAQKKSAPVKSELEMRYNRIAAALRQAEPAGLSNRQAMLWHHTIRAWYDFAREYVRTRPEVGMSVTHTIYTDRIVLEITRVSPSGRTFWARRMRAVRTDKHGMIDSGQEYAYEEAAGEEQKFTWRAKINRWKAAGIGSREVGGTATLAVRDAYHDFGF